MIYAVVISVAIAAVGLHQWRERRLARNPALWPDALSQDRLIRLINKFLKQDGWELNEVNRSMNIFVRAKRDNLWLSMMVHTRETLSLPTLIADCNSKHSGNGIILGILSQEHLSDELKRDAERNGIYVLNAVDLKDVDIYIRRAVVRRKQFEIAPADPPNASHSALLPQTRN